MEKNTKKTPAMPISKKLLSLAEAAKQVKYLLSAVSNINGKKCMLSISQIKLLIDGAEKNQKFYISKFGAYITLYEPIQNDEYIGINVSKWFDEDKYIISIY